METGPNGRGNGCLSAELGSPKEVRQPSLVPYRESSESSDGSESPGSPGGSNLEGSAMVSSSPRYALGGPPTDSSPSRPHPESGQAGPTGADYPASRVTYLQKKFNDSSLSEEASRLLLASWRTKSNQSYDSHFRKWLSWCSERGSNPVSGPVAEIANFLAHLFKQGYQSRSLNAYRSAIASVHDKVVGMEIGKHPMITRLLKGAFHARPPLPGYTATWSVQSVLQYIEGMGVTTSLSLKQLSHKLCMLLALARPSRLADLASLQIDRCRFNPEGVTFLPAALAKQSRPCKALTEYFFPSFPHNRELCPVATLRQYLTVTSPLHPEGAVKLFVAIIKPHNPVSSSSIARWLKETLQQAGIDVGIFGAHSVRGASSSSAAAAAAGVTTNDILKAADWSSESVFRNFYYRPTGDVTYGRAMLSQRSGSET